MTDEIKRMSRVRRFYNADGTQHDNTCRLLAPFRLMSQLGDYFDVPAHECLAGNLGTLVSTYSKKLRRRFSMRTIQNRDSSFYRVTLVALTKPRRAKAPQRVTKSSKPPAVIEFTDAEGHPLENTAKDAHGHPCRYPLSVMPVGSRFKVPKKFAASARAMTYLHAIDTGWQFSTSSDPTGAVFVVRLS